MEQCEKNKNPKVGITAVSHALIEYFPNRCYTIYKWECIQPLHIKNIKKGGICYVDGS